VPTFSLDFAKLVGEELGIDWRTSAFPPEELQRGMEVELEHGSALGEAVNVTDDDPHLTAKIAWAHLMESPYYYKGLALLEKKLESLKEKKAAVKTKRARFRRAAEESSLEQRIVEKRYEFIADAVDLQEIWEREWKAYFKNEETDAMSLRLVGLTEDAFLREFGKRAERAAKRYWKSSLKYALEAITREGKFFWKEEIGRPAHFSNLGTVAKYLLEYFLFPEDKPQLLDEAQYLFDEDLGEAEMTTNQSFPEDYREELWSEFVGQIEDSTLDYTEDILYIDEEAETIADYMETWFVEMVDEYFSFVEEEMEEDEYGMSPQELRRYMREELEQGPR